MKIRLFALFVITALSGCQDPFISTEEKINMAESQIRGDDTDYEMIEKVIGLLQEEAEDGNPDAMYWLARAHYKGLGVERDHEKMADLLKSASAKGHAQSFFRLGQAFEHGNGVEKDAETALAYYEKGADAGSRDAMGELAAFYLFNADRYDFIEQNYGRIFQLAKQAAEQGSDYSMSVLASLYLERKSGFYSPKKALETLEKLRARGNPSKTLPQEWIRKDRFALTLLYKGFYDGSEDLVDLGKAEEVMIEQSKDPKASGQAFYFLADIQREKLADASDDKKTKLAEKRLHYLREAASQGYSDAADILCWEYGSYWRDESHEYHGKILNWCYTGAQNGDRRSQFNTGVMVKDEDPADALSWFTLAALQGHPDARRISDPFAASLSEDQRARAATKVRTYLKNNPDVNQRIRDRNVAQ